MFDDDRDHQTERKSAIKSPIGVFMKSNTLSIGTADSSGSAEKDEHGKEYLVSQPWRTMGTRTFSQRANEYLDKAVAAISGELEGEDKIRVLWLSFTLFFTVGGYWLLRSIKDPIISTIDGVDRIPQAKMLSLAVVFALVIICKCTTTVVVLLKYNNKPF